MTTTTKEGDIVERVALALYDARKGQEDKPTDWKGLARAAIAALSTIESDVVRENERLREAIIAAYRVGAKDVHDFLAKLPDDDRAMALRDDSPDLTEAAHTYVDMVALSTNTDEKGD